MKTRVLLFGILIFNFLSGNAQTVTLYTPKGHSVYAFTRDEMSTSDITYWTLYYILNYPLADAISSASTTYNCHSYAWNMHEGGPVCWLNEYPDLNKYWTGGSYKETTVAATAIKIFYYNGDHSAIPIPFSSKYESKWGEGPLMQHDPGYGPLKYNMTDRKYYTGAISGPSIVSCSGNVNFSLTPTPSGVTWSVTSALNIVGSNTNTTLTVCKNPSTSLSSATISAVVNHRGFTYNVSQITGIETPPPPVTSVSASPSSVSWSSNQSVTVTAYPSITSSQGSYQWLVSPTSGVSQSPSSNVNNITFSIPGSYTVGARTYNSCGTQASYITTQVYVY